VYTLADLFLYPSWVEAFPIPVLEAMACGVPVITSRANGLQEIAGDAAFLVDPGDPQEIAAALDEVLGNAQLRQSLSEQGLARAQHFSWRTCAEETLKVLQGLV
jgi:glycosyltransferase involved in cell wall biosynthesis